MYEQLCVLYDLRSLPCLDTKASFASLLNRILCRCLGDSLLAKVVAHEAPNGQTGAATVTGNKLSLSTRQSLLPEVELIRKNNDYWTWVNEKKRDENCKGQNSREKAAYIGVPSLSHCNFSSHLLQHPGPASRKTDYSRPIEARPCEALRSTGLVDYNEICHEAQCSSNTKYKSKFHREEK